MCWPGCPPVFNFIGLKYFVFMCVLQFNSFKSSNKIGQWAGRALSSTSFSFRPHCDPPMPAERIAMNCKEWSALTEQTHSYQHTAANLTTCKYSSQCRDVYQEIITANGTERTLLVIHKNITVLGVLIRHEKYGANFHQNFCKSSLTNCLGKAN